MCLCALVATGCAASVAGLADLDREALPTPEDYSSDLVILDLEQTVVYREGKDGPEARVTTRLRKLILRQGARGESNHGFSYSKEFTEFVDGRVTVVRPDGEVTVYTKDDFDDLPISAYQAYYSDSRIAQVDVPECPPGTVVESVTVTRELRPDMFPVQHIFGSKVPVLHSRFEVRAPADWDLMHGAMASWEPIDLPPQVSREEGQTLWVWDRVDLPSLPREPSGPSVWDVAERVAVKLTSWTSGGERHEAANTLEDHGRWVWELQKGQAEATPEIAAKVEEILADVPNDPRLQARALYDWVKEKVRYVAIEVGIGGWRPHSAREVFEFRYGDCKDKATLLKAMLQVAGIESHLATLYSHQGVPRDFILPSLGFTNHAILAIELPDGPVIVDPTERTVPFGQLPARDQEAKLLVNHPDKPYVFQTPPSTEQDNQSWQKVELTLEGGRTWKGRAFVETTGAYAAILEDRLLNEAGDGYADALAKWAELKNVKASAPSHRAEWVGDTWTVRGQVDVEVMDVGSQSGNRLVVRGDDLFEEWVRRLPQDDRKTPVVLRFRRTLKGKLELRLPEGSQVKILPEPAEIDSPFGRYELVWRTEGDTEIVGERTLVQTQRIVPPEQYEQLVAWNDAIRQAERKAIVVELP